MKKTISFLTCGMFLLLLCCFACGSGEPQLTPEQLRLQKIARIDSTLQDFVQLDSVEGYDLLANLTAEAWMLVDDSTGFIISQKNADKKRFIASITKMMSCLLAIENGNMDDTLLITTEDCVTKDAIVRSGDSYQLGDLIYEMMLVSDNDAAYSIAKHIGGDTLIFYDMMNQKAQYLGMDSTHFANPNGMPNDSNYSSASDLIRLARYCMCDSVFAEIVGTEEADIPLIDGRHLPCYNTNLLLSSYEGCIGIKTGYTRQAAGCLASAATRDGTTLYLVLLGSRNRASRFKETAILLDYGFNVMKALGVKSEK
ncbi:MAG: D-alanyl-D-alanine carboxypeptidase [Bacteroidaceae bacterium]|nr:D-alanyl-D-alanine carboxypeptidase [Bacteroidaceae bacterium]